MDRLEFTASLVKSLAWPGVALIVLGKWAKYAPQLARFVRTIRYKDFELTLRENMLEAGIAAEAVKQETSAGPPSPPLEASDKLIKLSEIDPALGIVEIWKRLEAEIIGLMQHNGVMRSFTPARFVEYLAKLGKITPNQLALFQKLRQIRNDSVHAHRTPVLTLAEVLEFSEFVDLLTRRLREIKSEPGYVPLATASQETSDNSASGEWTPSIR